MVVRLHLRHNRSHAQRRASHRSRQQGRDAGTCPVIHSVKCATQTAVCGPQLGARGFLVLFGEQHLGPRDAGGVAPGAAAALPPRPLRLRRPRPRAPPPHTRLRCRPEAPRPLTPPGEVVDEEVGGAENEADESEDADDDEVDLDGAEAP